MATLKTANLHNVKWDAVQIITLRETPNPDDPETVTVRATIRSINSETTRAGWLVTAPRSYVTNPITVIAESLGVEVHYIKRSDAKTFIAATEEC